MDKIYLKIFVVLLALGGLLWISECFTTHQGQDSQTANELTDNATVEPTDYELTKNATDTDNITKIEILEVSESDIGIFILIKTDYGLETQLNFAKPITDEEIKSELRRFYNNHRPENATVSSIKEGDKITW